MIRRAPRPQSNWTQVRNEVINDPRLSFKATAVLIYILSKPDHWRTSTIQLSKVKREGIDAVRTAMQELKQAGYVRTHRYQDPQGRWQYDTEVFDIPQPVDSMGTSRPPHRDNPDGENGDVLEPVKTEIQRPTRTRKKPRLCTACDGMGWALSQDGHQTVIHCPNCHSAGITH